MVLSRAELIEALNHPVAGGYRNAWLTKIAEYYYHMHTSYIHGTDMEQYRVKVRAANRLLPVPLTVDEVDRIIASVRDAKITETTIGRMHAEQASQIRATLMHNLTALSNEDLRKLRDAYGMARSSVLHAVVWSDSYDRIIEASQDDALENATAFLQCLAPVFDPTLEQ